LAGLTSSARTERSHSELRAAAILAGKEIRKLNFGKRDTPVLQMLERVLRDDADRGAAADCAR
jgi:hypothetical protein